MYNHLLKLVQTVLVSPKSSSVNSGKTFVFKQYGVLKALSCAQRENQVANGRLLLLANAHIRLQDTESFCKEKGLIELKKDKNLDNIQLSIRNRISSWPKIYM